jgi:hypothetical protein
MNVMRDALGGPWGTEGSLPVNVTTGNAYEFQFNYAVPEDFNDINLRLIGFIQKFEPDSSKCQILNAVDQYLDVFTGKEQYGSFESGLKVYPNPVHNTLIIEIQETLTNCNIEIRGLSGELVFQKKADRKKLIIDLSSFSNGIYHVILKNDKYIMATRVVIYN